MAITALFCFIFSWNEFVFALVLTRKDATTLPVIVSGLYSQHGVMWPVLASVALMALVPTVILALVAQKYLVRGMTMGAVK
jgi:ABC-type glycerol-3-phosphate transport system permease component